MPRTRLFVRAAVPAAVCLATLAFAPGPANATEPLEFTQSDFRALQATGFIDEVVRDADGNVTALVVDLRNVPQAVSGEGGANCANG